MRNKYILLRHEETIYQTKKKDFLYPWSQTASVSLTEKGRKQIKTAAKEFKDKNIDLIYSSDFLRTRQTAKIVAKELGLKVKFDKRLRDINFGIYHGKPTREYYQFFSTRKQKFSKRPPKGENWRDVKKRVKNFIKDIEKKHRNKTILIVSHGDPLWLLCGILKGLNEKEILERKYHGFRAYKDFYPGLGEILEVK